MLEIGEKLVSNLRLLNEDQKEAFDLIKSGVNVAVSGLGGSGKSFLIEVLKEELGKGTLVLSTTGISAVNIGGETFHSGLSIPIGHPTRQNLKKVTARVSNLFSRGAVKRIIIDEASMLTPGGFYSLTQRLKHLGKGMNIQIILFWDLGQIGSIMSPVEKKLAKKDYKTDKSYRMRLFDEMDFSFIELTKIERQDDPEYIEMLRRIRRGKGHYEGEGKSKSYVYDKEVIGAVDYFNKHCYDRDIPEDNIVLATTNKSVARYNERVFNANPNMCGEYTATITGNYCKRDKITNEYKEKDTPTDITLRLKQGLKVIILKNDIDEGQYVNGSTGVITGMTSEGVFLKLTSSGEEIFIEPHRWTKQEYDVKEDIDGIEELVQYVSGSFEQIPVKQCAALSVHRSQGQTLGATTLDWGSGAGWASGLAYVSLSRVSKKEDMYFKRPLRLDDIKVDHDALDWLEGKLKESKIERISSSGSAS